MDEEDCFGKIINVITKLEVGIVSTEWCSVCIIIVL